MLYLITMRTKFKIGIRISLKHTTDIQGKILAFIIIQYMCHGQLWQDVSYLILLKVYLGLIDVDKFTAEKSFKDFEIQGTPPHDSVSYKA